VIIDQVPDFDIQTVGPHPGLIEPCRAYVFEHRIQTCLKKLGTQSKDDNWRITGVHLMSQMMKSLGLPTKTFNTAATVFHRFRLQYSLDSGLCSVMVCYPSPVGGLRSSKTRMPQRQLYTLHPRLRIRLSVLIRLFAQHIIPQLQFQTSGNLKMNFLMATRIK
jgi:hypothetical protein